MLNRSTGKELISPFCFFFLSGFFLFDLFLWIFVLSLLLVSVLHGVDHPNRCSLIGSPGPSRSDGVAIRGVLTVVSTTSGSKVMPSTMRASCAGSGVIDPVGDIDEGTLALSLDR